MKNINIEKALYPEAGELQYCEESESFKALILDVELDPIEVEFMCDDTIQINTEGYTFLTLDLEKLEQLIFLMGEAEVAYADLEEDLEEELG
jgi:hypothetical protein